MTGRWTLTAALALLSGCGAARTGPPPVWERPGLGGAVRPEMGAPQPGDAAPALALPDGAGQLVSLASMRGGWVLVHFTATWCPFCDREIEHLNALAAELGPRGLTTLLVDVEEDPAVWRSYASQRVAAPVVALSDFQGTTAARFAPPGAQPSFVDRAQAVLDGTVIVDPAGAIALFLLPDSAHFDPTFAAVREELDRRLPRPVVTVRAAPCTLAAGAKGQLGVRLEIAPGFHVMSDRPSAPSYIPTRVQVAGGEPGLTAGPAVYPPSSPLQLGDRAIAVFAGAVDVRVPLEAAPGAAPGTRLVQGTLRYQACTASECRFPETRTFQAEITVEPGPPAAGPAP